MSVEFTRKGRYRLSHNGIEISQHNAIDEAYENAIEHAEANDVDPDITLNYRIDPPWMELAVRRNQRLRFAFPIGSAASTGAIVGSFSRSFDALTLVATATQSTASTLYAGLTPNVFVATSAQGTGSGSSEANATTFADALANAVAGDKIGMLAGVYTHVASPAYRSNTPGWHPTNSGTAANPIRIIAKYPGAVMSTPLTDANRTELRAGSGAYDGSDSHPCFGSTGRNYIRWIGMVCDESNCVTKPDNGPVYLHQGTGCWIELCAVKGASAVSWADNHSAIRIGEGGSAELDHVVRNNKLWNFNNTEGGSNVAAIVTYGARNVTVEQNEVWDCVTGYYIKGSGGGGTNFNYGFVRFNYLHDVTGTSMRLQDNDTVELLEVYQNLVKVPLGSSNGVGATTVGSTTRKQLWHHNTVYVQASGGSGLWTRAAQTTMQSRDNLVVSAVTGGIYQNGGEFVNAWQDIDYNGYYGATGNRWSHNGADFSTLAAWRTETGDEANAQEFGTQPLVNPGTDFHLAVGHAARTASSTGGPVGCYITGSEEIGVESSGLAAT